MIVRRALFPAVAVVVALLAAPPATACSCIYQPLGWHIANTGVIAEGTVLSITPIPGEFARVAFQVSRTWKAPCPTGSVVEIVTSTSGGGCGYGFVDGESYLLFAQPDFGPTYGLGASSCGATTILSAVAPGTIALLEDLPPPPRGVSDPAASFAAADAVFRGRVLQVTRLYDSDGFQVRFSVLEAWKGVGESFLEVLVEPYPGSSGFQLYTDHVLFAAETPDGPAVACGESIREQDADDVLAWLRENAPVPVEPVTWGRLKVRHGDPREP